MFTQCWLTYGYLPLHCISLCRSDRTVLPHPCNATNCECPADLGLQAVWCLFGGCPVPDRHSQVLLWHSGCPVCHGATRGAAYQCTFQIRSAGQGRQEELGQVMHWSPSSDPSASVRVMLMLCQYCIGHYTVSLPTMTCYSASYVH